MAMKPRGLKVAGALVLIGLTLAAATLTACQSKQAAQQAAPAQAAQQQVTQQQAAPQTPKPTAVLDIVPVPADPTNPNAILGTLGDGKTKVAMGTTGLNNVSVGAPVALAGSATDPKLKLTKYAWTLAKPSDSKATLDASDKAAAKFTPDVSGVYKVDLVVSNEAGASPMASVQIHAGEYIGVEAGNCAQCHPQQTKEWAETGHAIIFKRELNGGADPATSHYSEGCIRCHTTGYNLGAKNGGFADLQAQTGWKFPDLKDIQTGQGQWEAVPEKLAAMANIQCEDCHGPAKDHVLNGAKMSTSLDEGVCNACHNGGGHHIKGNEFVNAGHSDKTAQAWTYPVGPSRQDCVRCHSGAGYASFLANPKEPASWDNSMQTASCSSCHDPHSDANKFQLRITGKPVEANGITKDFGLSATCVECHNGRTTAADAAKSSFPHYSPAGEMLSDQGGVTYGQTVPNSPHGMMVGVSPVKDTTPGAAPDAMLFGGNAPGACVQCHMTTSPSDAKDPNHYTVGEHSFNTTSPDGTFQYTAACQSCHPGVKDFNFQAKADYDGNGEAETVQQEVAGMLTTLQKAISDSGIKPVEGHPYFDQSGKANWTEKQKNAMYNYLFVRGVEGTDGKANAIHNFKRSVALLQLSYKDLTGNDVPNATVMK
jgi:predicted CXXCH cytochrome family protein